MQSPTLSLNAGPSLPVHLLRALRAVVGRELNRFLRQPSRLGSALVRPLLWFVVFSAGFNNVFGVAIVPQLANLQWARDRALRIVPLPATDVVRQVGLLERRHVRSPPCTR